MVAAPVMLAVHAMATRFELVLHGDDPPRLRAAGQEALAEIERVERLLSAYRADSDVARVNRDAARGPVRVTAETCRFLQECQAISRACGGAFDVTAGPLVRAWRQAGAAGTLPTAEALAEARAAVGFGGVVVDLERQTVAFERPGMAIDPGAAGKGYGIDKAIDVLLDAGVTSALLHGGTSSVHAIGSPPGAAGWRIGWGGAETTMWLRDGALSVSAAAGRTFVAQGRTWGHVVDPRSGEPIDPTRAAGVTGPSSLVCDAVSTALLVRGDDWPSEFRQPWPAYTGWSRAVAQPVASE